MKNPFVFYILFKGNPIQLTNRNLTTLSYLLMDKDYFYENATIFKCSVKAFTQEPHMPKMVNNKLKAKTNVHETPYVLHKASSIVYHRYNEELRTLLCEETNAIFK